MSELEIESEKMKEQKCPKHGKKDQKTIEATPARQWFAAHAGRLGLSKYAKSPPHHYLRIC